MTEVILYPPTPASRAVKTLGRETLILLSAAFFIWKAYRLTRPTLSNLQPAARTAALLSAVNGKGTNLVRSVGLVHKSGRPRQLKLSRLFWRVATEWTCQLLSCCFLKVAGLSVSWTNEILGININYVRAVPKLGAVVYDWVWLDTRCPLFPGSQVAIKYNRFYCYPLHKKDALRNSENKFVFSLVNHARWNNSY